MNFQDWLTAITTILQSEDVYGAAFFDALAPRIIERAELMIYRDPDLDLIALRTVDDTQLTNTGLRVVPQSQQLVIIETVSLIIPANARPAQGTRIPMVRTDIAFIDMVWPQETLTKAPNQLDTWYWALPNMFEAAGSGAESDEDVAVPSSIVIAPTPDNQYVCEQRGVFRPAPLSATNTTTFLTTYLPDLFLAASVVSGALLERDMGATGAQQDPSLAAHWSAEYERLKGGAMVESARQKARSVDWTVYAPATIAGVQRGQPPMPPQPAR